MSVQLNDLNPHWDRPVLSGDRPSNVLDFRAINISPTEDLTNEGALRLIEAIYAKPKPRLLTWWQRLNQREHGRVRRLDAAERIVIGSMGSLILLLVWTVLSHGWQVWR